MNKIESPDPEELVKTLEDSNHQMETLVDDISGDGDNIILETEDGDSEASGEECGYCGECFDDEDQLNNHIVSFCVVPKLNPDAVKIALK